MRLKWVTLMINKIPLEDSERNEVNKNPLEGIEENYRPHPGAEISKIYDSAEIKKMIKNH